MKLNQNKNDQKLIHDCNESVLEYLYLRVKKWILSYIDIKI